MENCTVCPFVKYWYVALAAIVVIWAAYKLLQTRTAPPPREIAGVQNLTAADFDAAIASGVTLVDFWAPWCGPCRMQMPIIEETIAVLPAGVRIAKVNVDEAADLARKFEVRGVPTWIVFKDGRELRRAGGVQNRENLLNLAKTE
ncbi:hypothetical protein SDC9_107074 [bioreactor metagenome]|uniref:Thioredoxin domain-containing protein n=1 Tax=bioreactor metagenome TaxID=1076179 RepID=A0A645BAP2_9ZZZZ